MKLSLFFLVLVAAIALSCADFTTQRTKGRLEKFGEKVEAAVSKFKDFLKNLFGNHNKRDLGSIGKFLGDKLSKFKDFLHQLKNIIKGTDDKNGSKRSIEDLRQDLEGVTKPILHLIEEVAGGSDDLSELKEFMEKKWHEIEERLHELVTDLKNTDEKTKRGRITDFGKKLDHIVDLVKNFFHFGGSDSDNGSE